VIGLERRLHICFIAVGLAHTLCAERSKPNSHIDSILAQEALCVHTNFLLIKTLGKLGFENIVHKPRNLRIAIGAGNDPAFHNPIKTAADINALATPPAEETLGSTLAAIRLVVAELEPGRIPLIGFAGAPFTLASYAIEGGGSKDFVRSKTLMYRQPEAWGRLMDKLVTVQADYLLKQAQAGAAALQIFDSWIGLALSKTDYVRFVQP
jgi:uroporphyrinogen-III decarboxylase